jgi:hypothetical protein
VATGGTTATGGAATGGAATGGAATGGNSGTTPGQCIVYVKPGGTDSNDGSSWPQAFATVQKGLNAAAVKMLPGIYSVCEIWVAEGTYLPTENSSGAIVPSDPRTKTFHFKAKVALYGGFVGTESSRDMRGIVAHKTVLSGDIGTPGDTTDNTYHVVTGASNATIDGFTITLGHANGTTTDATSGAGMYNAGSPTVSNCTFSNNLATSGAGMYNTDSAPVVTNCTFKDNIADFGGGMYSTSTSVFYGPTVSGCTFTDNMVYSYGGAMYNASAIQVTNSRFEGNAAAEGGGIYNGYNVSPSITYCTFISNTGGSGGGMYNYDNTPTVRYCLFIDNIATKNLGSGYGGGMYNASSSTTTVTNCTFSGNTAVSGGGVYNDNAPATLLNCILWGNLAGSSPNNIVSNYYSSSTLPTVTYSDVQGGCPTTTCGRGGTGNLDADPMFVDAAMGNVRLQTGSPCVDTGQSGGYPTYDIVGQAWLDIPGVGRDGYAYPDMGAYEYHP